MSEQVMNIYSNSHRIQNNRTSIAIEEKKKISTTEADEIIESVGDLITNPEYKLFFYKHLYRLGKGAFLMNAEKARKYGREGGGSRLFVHLIKS